MKEYIEEKSGPYGRSQTVSERHRAGPELILLLEAARSKQVTEEELHEQRISFAFGNALESELITKESVRLSSKNIKLLR